jgi:hypothetical protein
VTCEERNMGQVHQLKCVCPITIYNNLTNLFCTLYTQSFYTGEMMKDADRAR